MFYNSFVAVSGGTIEIDGVVQQSPYTKHVLQNTPPTPISAEALYNVVNGIEYTFNHWDDYSTSYSRTVTPSDHATYIAYFNPGIPLSIKSHYNLQQTATVGQHVRLQWTEHPNPNVTQYQIWRIVKQGSTQTGPTLVATVNRGTTTWTDANYDITNGYTDLLLSYDARAYYATEGTYASPDWLTVFGTYGGPASKILAAYVPTEFYLSSYPNPFNPITHLDFGLPRDEAVSLAIYDMIGRKVITLVDGRKSAGLHNIVFNASGLTSGVYLFRFQAGSFAKTGKLLLTK